MKTKQMTLSNSPSQRMVQAVACWLHRPNAFLSQLIDCDFSHLSLICALAFAMCAATAILLASELCELYGWASFFALAALDFAIPVFNAINRNLQR